MLKLYKWIDNSICRTLAFILLTVFVLALSVVSADGGKRVLLISSYSYDFVGVPHEMAGIKDALGNDVEMNYLFMDAKQIGSDQAEAQLYERLKLHGQTHRPYDAVILADDDALNFMRKYRQEFFQGVPLVYTGINTQEHALAAHAEGMTGVIETVSFGGTIKAGQKIFPQAKRVVGIIDSTPTGQGNLVQFMDEMADFPELEFSYVDTSAYTQAGLAEKLASFGSDTILLFIVFTDDKDGNHYSDAQAAHFVSAHARIPYFSVTEIGFGTGALGGDMNSVYTMGYKAGAMVRRIIFNGESPAAIPPETMVGTNMFDYAVMERFNIKRFQLPTGSVIINEPETLYTKHKDVLLPMAGIFLLLLIWLAREIRNNRRRKHMLAVLAANSAMMRIAITQSGLHLWEYFPQKKAVRLDKEFNSEIQSLTWLENYPQCWIDGGYVHPDDAAALRSMVSQIDAGAAEAYGDLRVRYSDGMWHWERLRYISIYDYQGQRTEVIGTAEKIEAYKAMEERFLISMKQSGIIAWVYDIHNNFIVTEKSDHQLFIHEMPLQGFPDSVIDGAYVHPDDVEAYRLLYTQVKRGDKTAEATVRRRLRDGSYRWYRIIYTTIFDADDEPSKAFGTGIDVTEQKRSEERFAAELRRTAALEGETLASSYFDLDTEEILEWNYENKSYAAAGMKLYEGIADAATHIPDEQARNTYLAHLQKNYLRDQYEQGNHAFTLEYKRRTLAGKLVWVRTYVNITKHYDTGHLAAYVYTRDIDKVKNRQLALDGIVKEEIEYICLIDVGDQSEYIVKNRPDCEFLVGHTYPYELLADCVAGHAVAADRALVQKRFSLAYITGQLDRGETVVVYYREADPSGQIRRKRTTIYYLDERREKLVYVRSDITELYDEEQRQKQQLEEALRKAESANRAKSDFLSHMSHEIRTPMNTIIGLAQLIAGRTGDQAYVAENIEKINMSAHFLLSLINDILDISRIESGRMELNEEDVHFQGFLDTVNSLVCERSQEKGVRYAVVMADGLCGAYHFDELKLKQVLINILSNAVKFTDRGGSITFTIEKAGGDDLHDQLRFSIADTGVGIDEAFLPRVFDSFAQEYGSNTTLYGGTGLGLAISQNIIRLMGGTIHVTSKKGQGTTFVVDVQLRRAAADAVHLSHEPSGLPQERYDFTGRHVLLAEDNDINREIAQTILEEAGFVVDTAINGQAAVAAYMGHDSAYYDAILMDVRMPVMDGLEAARRIRASQRDDAALIPILALTANAFEEDVKKSLAAGMNAHLSKPIEPQTLFYRLQEFLQATH